MIFLKTIALQGFKSFARLTTVEFSPGLNVIVGPNGSGKSNLLDAIRFVLGEKGREGRGGKAAWVIFHGSSLSKPLGMAMVETNWVERENGVSWSIERRIFASGESEYFWNGEKVRLGDMKSRVQERGFSLERMNMGVVSSDQLIMLFEYRPRERLQWMEQMSGILEIRTKLNALLMRLESAKEREQRFAERLKEIKMQVERLRGLAQEEREYLRMEQEVRLAKKWYLWKLKSLKEERANTLQRERDRLEGEIKNLTSKIDHWSKELSLEKRELDSLLSSLRVWQKEEEEWRSVQRKLEEELYYLVTRCRESVKLGLGYGEKQKILEKDVTKLENQVKEWLQKKQRWIDLFNGDRAQEKVSYFRKAYLQKIALLDEERIVLEKELSQREMSLRRLKEECQEKGNQKDKIQKKLEKFTQQIGQKEALWDSLCKRKGTVEEEIQKGGERLHRKGLLLKSIIYKLARLRESSLSPEVQKILRRLHQEGWSQRALYALSWFLQDKGWYEKGAVHPKELKDKNLGKIMLPFPFSSWSLRSPSEIQSLLQGDAAPCEHLVSTDGSFLVLQGGILVFPFQTVSPERGLRFLRSLQKRRTRLEAEIQAEKQRREDLEKELQGIERRLWEVGFELERDKQQKIDLKKEYQDLVIAIEQKKKTEEEVQEMIEELHAALSGLQGEKKRLGDLLKKLDQTSKRIQSIFLEKRKVEQEGERFKWEIQTWREKWHELCSSFERERNVRLMMQEKIFLLLPKLGECQTFLQNRAELLQRERYKQKMMEAKLKEKLYAIQKLEGKKAELIQKVEKLRLQEERLFLEKEVLEKELAEFGNVEMVGDFASWESKRIEEFVREKEEYLKMQKVRRGAIEELQDFEGHYHDFREKDEEILTLLQGAEKECLYILRESKKRFQEFLQRTKDFFEGYFGKIFPGGEVYFLEDSSGIDIEVRIPGKRRQALSFLSSGERALTALCLFFAVLEAGRFPFCFLDEVDANLDHVNSTLFAQMLSDFARSHQVVIVTHQEEVMEKAQRIVGVTMNEPGVSQVVFFEPSSHEVIERARSEFLLS